MKATIRLKGGKGSGHHGHAGRPGKRGGSTPGGGRIGTTGVERNNAKDALESMAGVLRSAQFQHASYRTISHGDEVEHDGKKYIVIGTNRSGGGYVVAIPKNDLTKMLDVVGADHTPNNLSEALAYVSRHRDTNHFIDKLIG